jgi:acyl-CoA thioester hydrolase
MIHEHQIRVRYAETDQMGFVYYGNYGQYFEVGRVEFLRSRGYSYKQLEEDGVMMPVTSLKIQYKRPAKYDDLLTVKTCIKEMMHKRVLFQQEVYNEKEKLLTTGEVMLAFLDAQTMRPIDCPEGLKAILLELVGGSG